MSVLGGDTAPQRMAAAVLGTVLVIGASVASPAVAAPGPASEVIDVVEDAVMNADGAITEFAATLKPADDGAGFESVANGVKVVVPTNPRSGITLSRGGAVIGVSLPVADVASSLARSELGLLTYDNGDGSHTVPIVGDDGSLQINTVIDSESAPRAYEYVLDFPDKVEVQSVGDSLLFFDSQGSLVLFVVEPWAVDSAGKSVPTSYEVNGNVLIQTVEHDVNYVYPVVADPWLGVALFQSWKRDTYQGDYRYSAWVTPGAVAMTAPMGYVGWRVMMATAGWDEWKAKWPAITNKASLWEQYDCHAAAGVVGLPFTQDWNLERFRPNRVYGEWYPNVVNHKCNWVTSTGGV